ncbi:carboxypeptidase-like regulatory domain-containing protein [Gloeocapsa sp. PCC 73106]|uniref:carboxypeptidase-like regulatory domain-containing protein n=1 Tax=Gloeocapsa sp. PCC 73106 TaxID=102232 RepID=UPI0002ABF048|nr:carboxypeptidase-like regulatory domain-containing protein [Gloeocapsa sp. PCC 73106]ELR97581.1 hypothetical protein GLO73106DRAFT_00013910 [Gloeocapsa sp. PCC 73106]
MSQSTLKPNKWLFSLLFLTSVSSSVEVFAHSAQITYEATPGILITATYDQGQPMAKAQVVVYAPSDPATPWLKGETDAQGNFSFIPDPLQPGNWDIKVRQSGHGALITIPINSENQSVINQSIYTPMQKLLMSASIAWGFLGTAMFFSRKAKR